MNAQKMSQVKSLLNSYFTDDKKGTFLSAILGDKTSKRVKPVKTVKSPSKRTDGRVNVRQTLDSVTLGFLRDGFISVFGIVQKLESDFSELIPEKSTTETLTRTSKRRVTSYFKTEKNIQGIERKTIDGETFYRLPSESESEKIESSIILIP